jgi:hypothetical protein
MRSDGVIAPSWDDRLNALLDQPSADLVAVITSICKQAFRSAALGAVAPSRPFLSVGKEPDFRRGRLLHVYSKRSTRASANTMRFVPWPLLGVPTSAPLF